MEGYDAVLNDKHTTEINDLKCLPGSYCPSRTPTSIKSQETEKIGIGLRPKCIRRIDFYIYHQAPGRLDHGDI